MLEVLTFIVAAVIFTVAGSVSVGLARRRKASCKYCNDGRRYYGCPLISHSEVSAFFLWMPFLVGFAAERYISMPYLRVVNNIANRVADNSDSIQKKRRLERELKIAQLEKELGIR